VLRKFEKHLYKIGHSTRMKGVYLLRDNAPAHKEATKNQFLQIWYPVTFFSFKDLQFILQVIATRVKMDLDLSFFSY
jgi:hypothetical protein